MYVRIVTFRLNGVTPAEYAEGATGLAPVFTTWPGLLAKVWIADEDTGTYGGVYTFTDRAAADRSRDTDVFRSLEANPGFADLTVREFDVLEAPTEISASIFTGVHAR